jgi:orotate phosphoribosyltransferase
VTERQDWLALLKDTGALQDGHFLLSSGRHSERYVQCARALESPEHAARMGGAIADAIQERVDRIVSPPLGALLIGYEVARSLAVPFAFPERGGNGDYVFRRGFELHRGERVYVVEDVITTGRTTAEALAAIERTGAQIVGVGAIVDRSETGEVSGFPIDALVRMTIPTYTPETCPACKRGSRPHQPGSRDMKGDETR